MSTSIIIPAFNEENIIGDLVANLLNLYKDYEILVIDDGSTDNTYERATNTGARVIKHPYNKGYGASLKTGIKNATGETIVTIDGDGQHNPEDIKKIVSLVGEYDMVVGWRSINYQQSLLRRPGKKVLSLLSDFLTKRKILDLNSGLRAFKKNIVQGHLHIMPDGFSISTTLTIFMFKCGYNVKYIPITCIKRQSGKSEVKMMKHGLETLMLILRIIMLFDPLRIFLPASGFLFSLGALTFLFYNMNITDSVVFLWIASFLMFFLGLLSDQIAAIRRERRLDE